MGGVWPMWNMQIVWPEINVKRFFTMHFDELNSAIHINRCHFMLFDPVYLPSAQFRTGFRQPVSPDQQAVSQPIESHQRFFIPVFRRHRRISDIASSPHMPFSQVCGSVTSLRSDESRVGKECVRTCRSRVWPSL